MASGRRRNSAGFTLLEAIFTIVVAAVLMKVAIMKFVTPASLTVQAQALAAADLIRRAQSVASVRGQRMSVTLTPASGLVRIACAAGTPLSCTSTDASYTLAQGAALAVVSGSANPIYFNSLGQPVSSGGTVLTADNSYTVSYSPGGTFTITVAALTGRVSVSP